MFAKYIVLICFSFALKTSAEHFNYLQDDRETFRREMGNRISVNKDRIEQMKSDLKSGKSKNPNKSKHTVKKLEARNKRLKKKLEHYDGKSDWQKFRKEMEDEMNDLDEAVTDAI